MFIDKSYFKGSIHIPFLNGNSSVHTSSNEADFNLLIEKCERELLVDAFGRKMYEDLMAEVTVVDGIYQINAGADAKWRAIVEGTDYTVGDKTYYWDGLTYNHKGTTFHGDTDDPKNQRYSLIAYYVYCKWLRDHTESLGGVGMQTEQPKNAERTSPIPKYTEAWRAFIDLYGGTKASDHPVYYRHRGVLVQDHYHDSYNGTVSLYRFLKDNETDYPDWEFVAKDNDNQFNI